MLDDFIALIPEEDLERINQQIDKLMEQENKKQSSIDFLIEQIEIILKLNNVELSAGYTIHTILPIIEKLKAMHKEEIEHAYRCGAAEIGMIAVNKPKQYYNETFGGDK